MPNLRSYEFNSRLSQLIKVRRKQLSFSQEYVAAQMGMAQSTLSRIEKGHLELSLIQWFQIQQILDLKFEDIVFDVQKPSL